MTAARITRKLAAISVVAAAWLALGAMPAQATTYYVSQSAGNDTATGKAAASAWKTLAKASAATYGPGDSILLKCGDTWDEELAPKGGGTPAKPVTIGSYGEGKKPVIDRQDYNKDLNGIRFADQGGFKIVGIEFNRCMTGIYAEYSKGCPTKKFIWIEDCYFHDSLKYGHYENYPHPKTIGLGVCFFSYELGKKIVLSDITIKNCVFRRLASGVWTNSPDNFNKNASFVYNFANLVMEDCLFEEGYQWQQGIRGCAGGAMRGCVTHDVGRGFRSFNGVAGSMFFRIKDWVFEDCEWGFISIGLGSADGEAFDFEGNCDNNTIKNCLFHDTDGPGFLLCCYASDGHPNMGTVIENSVLNGKAKRPIRLPRCEIVNTTDWNETAWKNCRFYLSPGEALMRTMDPEKDKRASFANCIVKNLSEACKSPKLTGKATASTEAAGNEAAKAADDDAATAWKPTAAEDQWIQLDFGKPVTINEFKIKEDPSSSVIRYVVECWDAKTSKWVSCFNGREIGAEFVAPIVSRTTTKARLLIKQTTKDNPAIGSFEAYNDTAGLILNAARGSNVPGNVGK